MIRQSVNGLAKRSCALSYFRARSDAKPDSTFADRARVFPHPAHFFKKFLRVPDDAAPRIVPYGVIGSRPSGPGHAAASWEEAP